MSAILETERDRVIEERVMQRILEDRDDLKALRLPRLSILDYLLSRDGEIAGAVEIKARKESMKEIMGYGGLMLKERKLIELQQFTEQMRVPTVVAFAFDGGEGPILFAEPAKISGLKAVTPPRRRNYRGLTCDEDPIVYLDWEKHLRRIK